MEQKVNGIITIFLSLLLCFHGTYSYAVTAPPTLDQNCPVEPIKQGDKAPCDGFYFNSDAEARARQAVDDADYYKRLSDKQAEKITLQDNENQILEKRLSLYMNESESLIKDRNSSASAEKLYLIGAFALGVIATGLAVRNVRQ